MSHYFTNDSTDNQPNRGIRYIGYDFKGIKFRFAVTDGVFSKNRVDYATSLLLNAIPELPPHSVLLDMGCGYGAIGIALAKTYSLRLTQADINKSAVDLTRQNCEQNGVQSQAVVSDCFGSITGKFDTIVINPPIHAGKSVTYKMYEDSPEHLNKGGKLYVVTLKKHGGESTLAKLKEVFDNRVEVIYKKKGFYVFACSAGE